MARGPGPFRTAALQSYGGGFAPATVVTASRRHDVDRNGYYFVLRVNQPKCASRTGQPQHDASRRTGRLDASPGLSTVRGARERPPEWMRDDAVPKARTLRDASARDQSASSRETRMREGLRGDAVPRALT